MSTVSARFRQGPLESKRYVLNYTLQLSAGESITNVVVNSIIKTVGNGAGTLTVTSIALLPAVSGAVPGAAYFVQGGLDQEQYEVQFLATTSVGQILEDVVAYSIMEKT